MTVDKSQAAWTKHGKHRGAQCNIGDRDLELVRRYGVLEHRTGVRFYFVGQREVERYLGVEPRIERLHGIVMIVAADSFTVITVYRNRPALKQIRHKSKRCVSKAA
jgi:hypothetical protein